MYPIKPKIQTNHITSLYLFMENGYIRLSRRFFSNIMWNEARTFSGCEAWLDLIQSARFDATPRKVSIGGREVSYSRGQYPASIRFLSRRWKWSEKKVRSFLQHLKKEGMITIECTQGMNIITLCNYDEYNPLGTAKGTLNSLNFNDLYDDGAQQRAQPLETGHSEGTKLNKENNNISLTNTRAREMFTPDELGDMLSESSDWLRMQPLNIFRQTGMEVDESDVLSLISDYVCKLKAEGIGYKSLEDARSHFANWVIKFLKTQGNGNNRANYTSKQEANEYAIGLLVRHGRELDEGMAGEVERPF